MAGKGIIGDGLSRERNQRKGLIRNEGILEGMKTSFSSCHGRLYRKIWMNKITGRRQKGILRGNA